MDIKIKTGKAVALLREMTAIPAVTFGEAERSRFLAGRLESMLLEHGLGEKVRMAKVGDNILLFCPKEKSRTLMLCAHMDTVPPSDGYSSEPYSLTEKDGRLTGLGVNDDGASLACLCAAFMEMAAKTRNLSLLLCLSVQEEKSGDGGMKLVLKHLKGCSPIPYPDYAIVGEPTGMKAAIAEKGLLVVDGESLGEACHAAIGGENNAIYNALADIESVRKLRFRRISALMGPTHLTVTQINAGECHNVQPASCRYVIDVRPNDRYSNHEIMDMLRARVGGRLKARGLDHNSRLTPSGCVLMQAVESLGIETYASSTSSDWSLLDIPAVKIGPGESSRSHKADEYVTRAELRVGIEQYEALIKTIDTLIR